jgi:hypothetical protein
MLHHDHLEICPLCEEKLTQAHSYMVDWFRNLKKSTPMIHVSWSFRNREDQEAAVKKGLSKLTFPFSKHNFSKDGKPCSLALDLFVLSIENIAQFPPLQYAKINADNQAKNLPIKWGGQWKTLGDGDHFEYSGNV